MRTISQAAPFGGKSFAAALPNLLVSLAEERDRWFLWSPVLVGIGVAIYFGLAFEPSPWAGTLAIAALLAANAATVVHDRRTKGNGPPIILIALLLVAVGFVAAQLRTILVDAPALTTGLGPTTVSGRVVEVETFPAGARLTLDHVSVGALAPPQTPDRVRLRVRGRGVLPHPGDRVTLRAMLEPLSAPTIPGGFDFQRHAYFQRLGAVGFVVGAVRVANDHEAARWSVATWFQSLRMTIGERVRAHHNDAAGAIIIALLVGETSGIPAPTLSAVRDAGLAHLLSISGVHIGMVAGMVFFWIRLLVAAIPWLALRVDAKKVAAVFAIASGSFYALLSGNSVPTQRALLMLTVIMIGVLVARRALSMRLLAWAGLVILLTQPESMLGASFQMSFAAMVGLIAASERSSLVTERKPSDRPRPLRRTVVYVAAIIASSVVATLATAPFAVFHFNRLALVGVLTNVIAIPLTGFWILPWGMLALLLMPFGGESFALAPMAWGTNLLILLAETAAAIPGSAVLVPLLPDYGLALIAGGGLWLCLWRTGWRFAGVVAIAAGVASMAVTQQPDILIDGRGKLIGVRLGDGSIALSSTSGSRFSRRTWLQRNGDDAPPTVWPQTGSIDGGRMRCDRLGCVITVAGRIVALPRTAIARADDCHEASLIVALDPFPPPCQSATRVVDWWDIWRGGAHAIWITPSAVRVETVNGTRGHRPWVRSNDADDDTEDP